ncbi:unnamed protein product, partial [Sphacelaria rigidula]
VPNGAHARAPEVYQVLLENNRDVIARKSISDFLHRQILDLGPLGVRGESENSLSPLDWFKSYSCAGDEGKVLRSDEAHCRLHIAIIERHCNDPQELRDGIVVS